MTKQYSSTVFITLLFFCVITTVILMVQIFLTARLKRPRTASVFLVMLSIQHLGDSQSTFSINDHPTLLPSFIYLSFQPKYEIIVLATAFIEFPPCAEELNTRDRVMKKIGGVLAFGHLYIYF